MSNYYPQGMQQQFPIQSSYYPEQSPIKTPSNPIGEEGVRALLATNNKLFFDVKQKDVWETLCYHTHNGQFETELVDQDRKLYRCKICKEIINLGAEISDKDLEAAATLLMTAWQQAKVYNYGVVSADIMFDYAQSLTVIKKFPKLYDFIMANYRRNSVQSHQHTQNGFPNVGQQTYNAIHSTNGFGYNPVYNSGAPTMMQSQAVGNPFQPTIQQPVMYVPQQPQIVQPVVPPQQYVQPQQQPILVAQQYQQPQIAYSYEQQPQQPMPIQNQQPPMPQMVPPAAAATVVPEQAPPQPPMAYPPKENGQQIPGKDSLKRALGFNL